jgi:hypothetical protein
LKYGPVLVNGAIKFTMIIINGAIETIDTLGEAEFYNSILNDIGVNLNVSQLLNIKNIPIPIQFGYHVFQDLITKDGYLRTGNDIKNALVNFGYSIKDGAVNDFNKVEKFFKRRCTIS